MNVMCNRCDMLALPDREVTLQTQKDRIIVQQRLEKFKHMYVSMERALKMVLGGRFSKAEILDYARSIVAENSDLKIDRLMKRSKPVLICWFCENIEKIPLLASVLKVSPDIKQSLSPKPNTESSVEILTKDLPLEIPSQDGCVLKISPKENDTYLEFDMQEEDYIDWDAADDIFVC